MSVSDSVSLLEGTSHRATALVELYQELENSSAHLPLATQPRDIIPGEGNPDAAVLLIGEAPGFHEQQERRPFVGRSGKLLRKLLWEAAQLRPEDCYITNIVKVRPPDNRDPTAEEILAFRPYLNREIRLIQPKLIVTLGRFSMAKFLPNVKISHLHGRLHKIKWEDSTEYILPLYHPAAALRSGKVAEAFREDLAKIPKILAWIAENPKDLAQTVYDTLL